MSEDPQDGSERIFKIGPLELRGRRRKPGDPVYEFLEALRRFKAAVFEEVVEPIAGPPVRWLSRLLGGSGEDENRADPPPQEEP